MTLRVVPGLEGAGVEDVALLRNISTFTALGWWIEPLCVTVTAVLLLRGLLFGLRERRRTSYLV
jgi:hypothetical protein